MPKIVKPLTELEIKNAKYTSNEEFQKLKSVYILNNKEVPKRGNKLSDGQGLYLIIQENGNKFFQFDFSYGGKRKSTSFGTYPKTTLKEARSKRDKALKLLEMNLNPISEKKTIKNSESLTLKHVIDEWIELRKKSSSNNTVKQNISVLNNINMWIGNIAIKDIKRNDIIHVLERVQNSGRIETAHRLFLSIKTIYKFSLTKGYIDSNIISDIDSRAILIPNNNDSHFPALTDKKGILNLLKDLNNIGKILKSNIVTIYIFKLIPYVFVRSSNIRFMKWEELDLEAGVWEIPKERMKNKIAFVCPLPIQAISIIKDIEPYSRHKSKYVFPSPQKNDRGISSSTLSNTLNNLGYKDIHSFHGFRSMFSTTAYELYEEHGFHSDIIEACLAHKDNNKIKAAYNRHSLYKYFEQKKKLIQWYADWLDKLLEDNKYTLSL